MTNELPKPETYVVTAKGSKTSVFGSRYEEGTEIDSHPGLAQTYCDRGLLRLKSIPSAQADKSKSAK